MTNHFVSIDLSAAHVIETRTPRQRFKGWLYYLRTLLVFRPLRWRQNMQEARFIYDYARGWQGERIARERFWRTLNARRHHDENDILLGEDNKKGDTG